MQLLAKSRCASHFIKLRDCISTLCKIAPHGADAVVRYSLRSDKAHATGVRRLRHFFMLSAPPESFVLRMKFSAGACIIFLKRKCRASPSHIQSTCPSKKRSSFCAALLPQMPLGVKWLPGVAASKQSREGKCVAVLF
jgi:hypothetical protein